MYFLRYIYLVVIIKGFRILSGIRLFTVHSIATDTFPILITLVPLSITNSLDKVKISQLVISLKNYKIHCILSVNMIKITYVFLNF